MPADLGGSRFEEHDAFCPSVQPPCLTRTAENDDPPVAYISDALLIVCNEHVCIACCQCIAEALTALWDSVLPNPILQAGSKGGPLLTLQL